MENKEFNLLDEPWILALTREGQTKEVSLLELFQKAHQLYALAGEMVTQDVAILRLLLGILYAVFKWQDLDGSEGVPKTAAHAQTRWKALWDRGAFPLEPLEDYLRQVQGHFCLFHPETPFLQVVVKPGAMVSSKGKMLELNPAEKEIRYLIGDLAESGNKVRLFSSRANKEEISCAEAARWLVHMNAFDVSPGGAPPRDGFRANGYKLPWPNTLGLVWAEGDNLFETLMLNFVLAPTGQDMWEDFHPAWEEDSPFEAQDLTVIDHPFPKDPCALLTFPFRRMQLMREEDGAISKLILWGGHKIEAEQGNPFLENMTLWQLDKQGNHVPKRLDPSRQMWRDLSAILPAAGGANPPGVVSWIARLKQNQQLDLPLLRLNSAGMVLAKSTSVSHVFSDSLRFHLALLDDLEEGCAVRVSREIGLADKLVLELGYFAANLIRAGGGSGEKDPRSAAQKAREQAYFLLDSPFRRWLEELDERTDLDEACKIWRDNEVGLLKGFAQEMVQHAGLKALVGRKIKEKPGDEKERLYAAPQLYDRLVYRLHRLSQS